MLGDTSRRDSQLQTANPRLGQKSSRELLGMKHEEETEVNPPFFGIFGQSDDPFGMKAKEEQRHKYPNPKMGIPTFDGPDKVCGYLEKKTQHPRSKVVLKTDRYFVWDKVNGTLMYFKDHKPGAPGTEALSVELFNKAGVYDTNKIVIQTFYATASHDLKMQKLQLWAGSKDEAEAWVAAIEATRLKWLMSTEPLIISVQKHARRFLAIKRAARAKALTDRQKEEFRRRVLLNVVGFLVAMVVLVPMVLHYRAISLEARRRGDQSSAFDAMKTQLAHMTELLNSKSAPAPPPPVPVAAGPGSTIVNTYNTENTHTETTTITNNNNNNGGVSMEAVMQLLTPLVGQQMANATQSVTSSATNVAASVSGSISSLFGLSRAHQSLTDMSSPELVAHIQAQAKFSVRALRQQFVTAVSTHRGKRHFKAEERVHSFSLTLSDDTRTFATSQLRVNSKLFTSDVSSGALQCMVMLHTDDGLNCQDTEDGRCMKIELFLEVLELAIQSEFAPENVKAQHFSIPQATFFTVDLAAW